MGKGVEEVSNGPPTHKLGHAFFAIDTRRRGVRVRETHQQLVIREVGYRLPFGLPRGREIVAPNARVTKLQSNNRSYHQDLGVDGHPRSCSATREAQLTSGRFSGGAPA